jgi:hypothetical protein
MSFPERGERKEFIQMSILSGALAEQTADLTNALEGLTKEEAAAGGAALGMAVGMIFVLAIVWFIFQAIADWKIFTKAGEAGWKSLIPIYNVYVEYDLCWSGVLGLVYIALTICANFLTSGQNVANWRMIIGAVMIIIALILHVMQSLRLARSFGKGTGFGICLILFGPIARMVLGFGSATYVGNRS